VSNFIPWSAAHPPILNYTTWVDHVNTLEEEACLRGPREPDILPSTTIDEAFAIQSARRSRLIAAGRLYDVDNCTSCFKTKKEAIVLLGKHRARARALWNQDGNNKPYDDSEAAQNYQASILVQKLRDKADRMKCPQDMITRQNDANWATEWKKDLGAALSHFQAPQTNSNLVSRLHTIWNSAAFPTKRSLAGGIRNPKDVVQQLKQPVVLQDTIDWFSSTIVPSTTSIDYITTSEVICDSDPFADINDVAYNVAVDTHKRLGLPSSTAPLNPEQRACGRDFIKIAKLRKDGAAQGFSATELRDVIHRLGLHQVTMMIGTAFPTRKSLFISCYLLTLIPHKRRCGRNGQISRRACTETRI
jgi:hypothetical protein